MTWAIFAIGAALSWGIYGAMLHQGQMALGSAQHRGLRALLCVGIAYFIIGVIVPVIGLASQGELKLQGFTANGATMATAAGALGAIGAACIIWAFKSGGVPNYVMPLVFGGAPVINTFASMAAVGAGGELSPTFLAGLIIAIIGAVTVLVFAPRGQPHSHAPASSPPQKADEPVQPVKT